MEKYIEKNGITYELWASNIIHLLNFKSKRKSNMGIATLMLS